jgi:hypothetical protein
MSNLLDILSGAGQIDLNLLNEVHWNLHNLVDLDPQPASVEGSMTIAPKHEPHSEAKHFLDLHNLDYDARVAAKAMKRDRTVLVHEQGAQMTLESEPGTAIAVRTSVEEWDYLPVNYNPAFAPLLGGGNMGTITMTLQQYITQCGLSNTNVPLELSALVQNLATQPFAPYRWLIRGAALYLSLRARGGAPRTLDLQGVPARIPLLNTQDLAYVMRRAWAGVPTMLIHVDCTAREATTSMAVFHALLSTGINWPGTPLVSDQLWPTLGQRGILTFAADPRRTSDPMAAIDHHDVLTAMEVFCCEMGLGIGTFDKMLDEVTTLCYHGKGGVLLGLSNRLSLSLPESRTAAVLLAPLVTRYAPDQQQTSKYRGAKEPLQFLASATRAGTLFRSWWELRRAVMDVPERLVPTLRGNFLAQITDHLRTNTWWQVLAAVVTRGGHPGSVGRFMAGITPMDLQPLGDKSILVPWGVVSVGSGHHTGVCMNPPDVNAHFGDGHAVPTLATAMLGAASVVANMKHLAANGVTTLPQPYVVADGCGTPETVQGRKVIVTWHFRDKLSAMLLGPNCKLRGAVWYIVRGGTLAPNTFPGDGGLGPARTTTSRPKVSLSTALRQQEMQLAAIVQREPAKGEERRRRPTSQGRHAEAMQERVFEEAVTIGPDDAHAYARMQQARGPAPGYHVESERTMIRETQSQYFPYMPEHRSIPMFDEGDEKVEPYASYVSASHQGGGRGHDTKETHRAPASLQAQEELELEYALARSVKDTGPQSSRPARKSRGARATKTFSPDSPAPTSWAGLAATPATAYPRLHLGDPAVTPATRTAQLFSTTTPATETDRAYEISSPEARRPRHRQSASNSRTSETPGQREQDAVRGIMAVYTRCSKDMATYAYTMLPRMAMAYVSAVTTDWSYTPQEIVAAAAFMEMPGPVPKNTHQALQLGLKRLAASFGDHWDRTPSQNAELLDYARQVEDSHTRLTIGGSGDLLAHVGGRGPHASVADVVDAWAAGSDLYYSKHGMQRHENVWVTGPESSFVTPRWAHTADTAHVGTLTLSGGEPESGTVYVLVNGRFDDSRPMLHRPQSAPVKIRAGANYINVPAGDRPAAEALMRLWSGSNLSIALPAHSTSFLREVARAMTRHHATCTIYVDWGSTTPTILSTLGKDMERANDATWDTERKAEIRNMHPESKVRGRSESRQAARLRGDALAAERRAAVLDERQRNETENAYAAARAAETAQKPVTSYFNLDLRAQQPLIYTVPSEPTAHARASHGGPPAGKGGAVEPDNSQSDGSGDEGDSSSSSRTGHEERQPDPTEWEASEDDLTDEDDTRGY